MSDNPHRNPPEELHGCEFLDTRVPVTAIRFWGEINPDIVEKFLKDHNEVFRLYPDIDARHAYIIILDRSPFNPVIKVHGGDWLVASHTGVQRYSDADFRKFFTNRGE